MTWRQKFKSFQILNQLIIINVVVFVLINAIVLFSGLGMHSVNISKISPAATAVFSQLKQRPWGWFTYMFVHYNFMHILFNMIALYFGGSYFVRFFGAKKLFSIYILGGVFGFLFYIVSFHLFKHLNIAPFAIGASASVMAIILAAATHSPHTRVSVWGVLTVPFWVLAAILVIYDFTSINNYANTGGHIAHLGGALFGFIFAVQFKKGKDYSMWLNKLIEKIKNFKWKRSKKNKMYVEKRFVSDEEFNLRKKENAKNVDRILDKISKSGYSSLTKKEKEFLNEQS